MTHPITVIHRKRPRTVSVPVTLLFKIEVTSIEDSEYGYVAALSINGKAAMHVIAGDSIEVTIP